MRFQIQGPAGDPVTEYQAEYYKVLHLIAVRRDLSHFQHVHHVLNPDGTWSVPLDLSTAGEYRVFAYFASTGHDGGLVLGADLAVPGANEPVALPEPAAVAQLVDGYQVTLAGDLERDGHLVALRAGNLAYLHVHPAGEPGDVVTPAGPGITFYATAPSAGDYRLFLDIQQDGVVRTAEFTVHAGETLGAATTPVTNAPVASHTTDAQPVTDHDTRGTDGHGH